MDLQSRDISRPATLAAAEALETEGFACPRLEAWSKAKPTQSVRSGEKTEAENDNLGRNYEALANEYGVRLRFIAGTSRQEFTIKCGTRTQVMPVDWKLPLRAQLQSLVDQKEAAIRKRFGVDFIAPDIEIVAATKKTSVIKTRHGRLAELYGIERALSVSDMVLPKWGSPNLRVGFVNQPTSPNSEAEYWQNFQGHPMILMVRRVDDNPDGLAYLVKQDMLHELVHQEVHSKFNCVMPLTITQQFGWIKSRYGAEQLKGKKGTYCFYKPGNPYSIEPTESYWASCDATGAVASDPNHGEEVFYGGSIRDLIEIRPPTNYFDDSEEEYAELLMSFRGGSATRAALFRDNRALYDLARSEDQKDIDAKFPPKHGASQYLRLPGGGLAKNNATSHSIIATFERRLSEEKR